MTHSDEPIPQAAGGPAFPVVEPNHPTPIVLRGMTLRDYFACCALAGMVERVCWPPNPEKVAADAYKVADAMLVERSQPVEAQGRPPKPDRPSIEVIRDDQTSIPNRT